MTSITQKWLEFLEQQRHNRRQEQISQLSIDEQHRANLANEAIARVNADTNRMAQQTNAQVASANIQHTLADIQKIKNDINSVNINNQLKRDQFNWQQQVDRFNNDINKARLALNNKQFALDTDKFRNAKQQWNNEFQQRYREYQLAVSKYKTDKTNATWNNVLKTAEVVTKLCKSWKSDMSSIWDTADAIQ